jgi:hypothetical protein
MVVPADARLCPHTLICEEVVLTGPEHYREAERVLAIAAKAREASEIDVDDDGLPFRTWTMNLAYVQAHATLAAAAASVVVSTSPTPGPVTPHGKEWREVTGW